MQAPSIQTEWVGLLTFSVFLKLCFKLSCNRLSRLKDNAARYNDARPKERHSWYREHPAKDDGDHCDKGQGRRAYKDRIFHLLP